MLGLGSIYNYNEHQGVNEVTTNSIGLAPSIQKYFPVVNNFAFNLEGSLEYEQGWTKNSSFAKQISLKRYTVAVRPGFSYFLQKHLALEATTGI